MSGKILLSLTVLLAFSCGTGGEEYYLQTVGIPEGYTCQQKVELSAKVLPHPRQMKWFEDEFFGFIHYGPNTYSGREWGTGFEDAALFNPGDLGTDQWCRLMKAAGIKRVIMVVKHHEGYCLWQTRYTDHSVASSSWRDGRGDVLRELAESCESTDCGWVSIFLLVGRRIEAVYGVNLLDDAEVYGGNLAAASAGAAGEISLTSAGAAGTTLISIAGLKGILSHGFAGPVRNVLDGSTDTWWQATAPEAVIEINILEERIVNRFMIREAIAHRGES